MTKGKKIHDLVVLVLVGEGQDSAKILVPLILTKGVIEMHVRRTLSDAQRHFREDGYVMSQDQEILFPTVLPETVQPEGVTSLQVWVKYED